MENNQTRQQAYIPNRHVSNQSCVAYLYKHHARRELGTAFMPCKNAREKNIFVDFINGYTDHVHCLVSMNDDLGIGKIVQLIKGESSHWINKNKMTPTKFQWQNEYMAVGLGFEQLEAVRKYIAQQEEHHKKMTSEEELCRNQTTA